MIDTLELTVCTVPLDEPESDGTFEWDRTTAVIVEVTGGGATGLGWTYGPAACATLVDDLLRPVVLGRPHDQPAAAWSAMVHAVRNAGRPGIASHAIAAVDIALWDLCARSRDEPLCRLLGMVRDRVPVYGSGGFTSLTPDALAAQLGGWVHDEHIPRVKMKVGRGSDVERVALARQAIGPHAELYVDANGAWSPGEASRMAERFAELDVTWFEEPVSSDDLAGMARVRASTTIDVATGEYGYDLAYFARLATSGAVDVVQADVTRCAGITEWRRIAALAAGHGLDISGHTAPALHAAVAASAPNLRHLEWFADHVRLERLLFDGVPEPVDGSLVLDLDRPGHGYRLRREAAARFS